MSESHIVGWVAGGIQFVVAVYSMRLNRRYGTARVGWSLFGAFSLLALLQCVQAVTPFGAAADSALMIHVTYALISFLLLIGMVHLEAMLKERVRMERYQVEMRVKLEEEVQAKTAQLHRAIDELVREMAETKRMNEFIETTETTIFWKSIRAEDSLPMAPAAKRPAAPKDGDEILAGDWPGQLAAQF